MIWGGAPSPAAIAAAAATAGAAGPNVVVNLGVAAEASKTARYGAAPYVGLGGVYGPAIAYWGLRALNAAAAAARMNAVQVRRASDNAAQNITVLPNGALDVATLTAFVAGTTGFVATWYDQSGNGYHMTQATAALQPQIVLNALGSLPAVLFDGARTRLEYSTGIPALNAPVTFGSFAQPQMGATHNTNYVYLDSVSGGWQGWQVDGFGSNNFAVFFAGSGSVANANNAWHAVQLIANQASSSVNLDGTATALSLGIDPQVSGPNSIGCDISGSSGPYQEYFKGYLVETSIFALGASAAQTAAAYANQNATWNLGSLPQRPTHNLELSAGSEADATARLEFSGTTAINVSDNYLAPIETIARPIADTGLPVEPDGTVRTARPAGAEMLAGRRADPPTAVESVGTTLSAYSVPVEWAKLFAVAADLLLRLETIATVHADRPVAAEFTGTAATTIVGDAYAPIEWRVLLRADGPVVGEELGRLTADLSAVIEVLVMTQRDHASAIEILHLSRPEGRLPFELLSSGTIMVADSAAPFENIGTSPAVILPIEVGLNRVRLLATPGRIRFLRRK